MLAETVALVVIERVRQQAASRKVDGLAGRKTPTAKPAATEAKSVRIQATKVRSLGEAERNR